MLFFKDIINSIFRVLFIKLDHTRFGIFTFWWKRLPSIFFKECWSPPLWNITSIWRSYMPATNLPK